MKGESLVTVGNIVIIYTNQILLLHEMSLSKELM